jgi:uncharacterized membrane protein YfcA
MITEASLAYGLIVMFGSSMLCSSAGVGGGSLNVPILYSIIGFDYDTAVILSLCALMGNYLLQVLINLDKRHPSDPSAPLIYWDAVLIMLPAELGGANLGVILAKAMPKTIIFVLAMTVLVIAVFFTTKKGLKLYHYESISIQEELEADEKGDFDEHLSENGSAYSTLDSKAMKSNATTTPLLSDSMKLADLHSDASSELNWPSMVRKGNHARKQPKITIASIIPPYLCCYYRCCTPAPPAKKLGTALRTHSMGDSEPSEYAFTDTTDANEEDLPPVILPWRIIFVIIAVFVLYLVCYVVQKEYDQCSLGNYICLAIIYILLLIQVLWGLRYLISRADTKHIGPSTQLQGEIHWGTQSLIVPLISFAIGITSALLGIGGGELMGPMLLLLRVSVCICAVLLGTGAVYRLHCWCFRGDVGFVRTSRLGTCSSCNSLTSYVCLNHALLYTHTTPILAYCRCWPRCPRRPRPS